MAATSWDASIAEVLDAWEGKLWLGAVFGAQQVRRHFHEQYRIVVGEPERAVTPIAKPAAKMAEFVRMVEDNAALVSAANFAGIRLWSASKKFLVGSLSLSPYGNVSLQPFRIAVAPFLSSLVNFGLISFVVALLCRFPLWRSPILLLVREASRPYFGVSKILLEPRFPFRRRRNLFAARRGPVPTVRFPLFLRVFISHQPRSSHPGSGLGVAAAVAGRCHSAMIEQKANGCL